VCHHGLAAGICEQRGWRLEAAHPIYADAFTPRAASGIADGLMDQNAHERGDKGFSNTDLRSLIGLGGASRASDFSDFLETAAASLLGKTRILPRETALMAVNL
jgi:hypothetical protein